MMRIYNYKIIKMIICWNNNMNNQMKQIKLTTNIIQRRMIKNRFKIYKFVLQKLQEHLSWIRLNYKMKINI